MKISRRRALAAMAGAIPAVQLARMLAADGAAAPTTQLAPELESGIFQATRESLKAWSCPQWFRDAKFGIWAHWGPQSAAEYGDWYARNMYMQGSKQYNYHVKTYGHPSVFGFKDIIPTWRADKFDPNYLMGLYKKAGAKYFMSMGCHHDNFDLWDSAHTRWNAKNMGPKKDIVGAWRNAAKDAGLKFAVSDHLWISYKWFATSHGSDTTGDKAGVPYDGVNPANADLYHEYGVVTPTVAFNANDIPQSWRQMWYLRMRDMVDKYSPDLFYIDGGIAFEQWGLSLVAHYYNQNAARNGGKVEAVYTSKTRTDSAQGTCVLDVERGLVDTIWPQPWQTDTCVGNWHYDKTVTYKTPKTVIDLLVDIVSRNGNLMLNFPLPNSGMLDDKELSILAAITTWMGVNSEGIYSSRPWKIFGNATPQTVATTRRFNEQGRKDLTAADVRFTTKGDALYAFVMGWPDNGKLEIPTLALGGPQNVGRIQRVELLGSGQVQVTQDDKSLKIQLPQNRPCDYGVTFKIFGA